MKGARTVLRTGDVWWLFLKVEMCRIRWKFCEKSQGNFLKLQSSSAVANVKHSN